MDFDWVIPGTILSVVVIIGAFTIAFLIINRTLQANHRERMALIETGMDPSLADRKKKEAPGRYGPQLWGSLLVGIGVGLVVGYFAIYVIGSGAEEELILNASALIFGGGALSTHYQRWKKKDDKARKSD
jgi:hypothetical protein